MLSTTTPSHLHRAPVHLENIAKAPNTQFSLTPNARLNNFVKEKAKFTFSGTSELEPIPERPTTTTHSKDPMKTRATLSRTSQSLNSLSSRRGGIKTQGSFMESSIVLDFMTETGGDTHGFQKKAVIRPVQKLKTQHFYNSVYDVREEEEPMEARIKQLEQLYKAKAENTLWNTPPQQLMRNVLESYARVQPKGIIKQYLDYMQDKSDVQKIQRQNNRPSSSTRGNAKARTVEGFFKDEQNQDKQEILQILRGQKKYQDMSKIAGKDITESINDYISTLENCNTLLMTVRDPQSLENFEDLLDETPEKSQGSKHSNEKPFERWSEESAHKTEEENVPKIHMNDYADIKEDANRKMRLIQFPAPNNEIKSTSRLTKSAVNKINAISKGSSTNGLLQSTFYATKTKAIAIIRQRPSTTGSKPNSTHRIPFKEAVMNSLSVKNNNLMLEGKKALPEMLDNPYKFTSPKAPVMTDNAKEEECVSPKTPNNWILEGMTIQKSEQNVAEKKAETIFRRKGHINKQTRVSSAKTKNILSLMKRPNSENNASKRKNDGKTNEFARADQSPKDLLNAWASEESVIPSFKIKKIESSFEPQIIQEVL